MLMFYLPSLSFFTSEICQTKVSILESRHRDLLAVLAEYLAAAKLGLEKANIVVYVFNPFMH